MKSFLGTCLVLGLGVSAPLAAGEAAVRRPADADNRDYVAIGAARMDVRLGAGIQLPPGWRHEDTAARRRGPDPYRLVKFAAPVGSRERELLRSHGLTVVAFYPYDTFLVRPAPGGSLGSLDDLAAVAGVVWIGPFHPYFKIGRELADRVAAAGKGKLAVASGAADKLVVGLHEEARRAAVEAGLTAIPGVEALLPTRGPIRVRIDPNRVAEVLLAIAALPDVAFIEPALDPEVGNDENLQTTQSGACNASGPEAPNTTIFNHGITGWGARIAIADTCVDANEGWFYDGALAALPPHEAGAPWTSVAPDWSQRKIVEYYDMYSGDTTLGCGGTSGCGGACPDHGTHVSGTAAGNCNLDLEGVATATDPANRDGDNDGMAPGARLVAQDLGNGTLRYLSVDGGTLGELIHVAYTNTCDGPDCGIDVHNDSWNTATDAYNTDARTADAELWALKNLVVVVSVGNAGVGGYDTMRAPATGKNVLGVGSAFECQTTAVATTSGRGDTSDGRLKPDVVMGGDSVVSAQNDGDGSTNANGGCQVTSINGTSMAAGTASGALALAVQYLEDGFYPGGTANPADALDPSGMLLKALLINSAKRMTGSSAEPSGVTWPNMDQGWGHAVLDNALYFAGDVRNLWLHDEPVGVDVSGTASMSFQRHVTSGAIPLKVTLVWYDKEHPGSCGAGSPCLLDDLDLTVTDDTTGASYSVTLVPGSPGHLLPRTVVAASPQAGQTTVNNGPDDLNTVEQIIVYSPTAPANYTFTVTGASTPDGPIPFALVATGALGAPCPEPVAPANNSAADIADCFDNGVQVTWAADPPDWGDPGASRFYQVLRDGVPIASGPCGGLLPYGTSFCTDATAPTGVSAHYAVRYRNACGGTVVTAGVSATDETGPQVDVTPDGASDVCPGAPLSFTAAVDPPAGSYTYQWTQSGVDLPGETGPVLTISQSAVDTRSYNVRVTDAATGCIATDPAASVGQWTTNFSDVDYDPTFNPLPTLAESCGDGDGVVEAGEVWRVTTRLENFADCGVAPNAHADLALSTTSAAPASVCESTGYYGTIPAGGTATHAYAFRVDPAATCGQDATFDVTQIWWSGGAGGPVQPAFDLQVGVPATGNQQTATQFTDPLAVASGSGLSSLLPQLTLPSATGALLDYDLTCGPGPLVEIYGSIFTNLSGWTTTGSVSASSANADTCVGSGGNNAYFNGNGTITRTVSTTGLAGITIEANFRGGAAYSDPGQCFKWWYSTNNGSSYLLYKNICGSDIPAGTWRCKESFSFPAAAENNSGFRIRFETTGGVDIRLDKLSVKGGAPACAVQNNVLVELQGPHGGVWLLKDLGVPDPPKPIDVTSFYNNAQGGTGLWRIRVQENSGGTATLASTALAITDGLPAECDVSASCACPAATPGEVSNDPGHFLAVGRSGPGVDLLFEDLGAPSYNVYVSTARETLPFAVTSGLGKKDCHLTSSAAPGGMRSVNGYAVESGIAVAADVYFILVTASSAAPAEGVAGYTSSGTPRSIDSTCD